MRVDFSIEFSEHASGSTMKLPQCVSVAEGAFRMPDQPRSLEPIDQLAAKDPIWRKVLEEEENTPHIKLLNFMTRMSEARGFTTNVLALQQENREKLFVRMMQGVREMISDPKFWKTPSDKNWTDQTDNTSFDAQEILYSEMEKSTKEKIEKYRIWILNQALVIYCTILDTALEQLLDAIFRKNEMALYGVSEAKSIDFKKMIALGSIDAVKEDFRKKVIKNFSFEEISQRFQFLKSKLGIDIKEIFNWGNQDERVKDIVKDYTFDDLKDIYNLRHSIVHHDATPITSEVELADIAEFFIQTYYNLAHLVLEKFSLTADFVFLITRQERYNVLKAQVGATKVSPE